MLGAFDDGPDAGSAYVNVATDDRTLFASYEGTAAITVSDLARARRDGFLPPTLFNTERGVVPKNNSTTGLFEPLAYRAPLKGAIGVHTKSVVLEVAAWWIGGRTATLFGLRLLRMDRTGLGCLTAGSQCQPESQSGAA